MASKLTLNDIVASSSETTKATSINANSEAIELALDKTLSRDGTSPNEMQTVFDMNGYQIINLPLPVLPTEPIRKQEFDVFSDQMDALNEAVYLAQSAAAIAQSNILIPANLAANPSRLIRVNSAGTAYELVTDKAVMYQYDSVASLKTQTTTNFDTTKIVNLLGTSGGRFIALSGTALANGYPSGGDDVVVIQNNAGTLTFVRELFITDASVDLRWWNPSTNPTVNSSPAFASMFTAAGNLANANRPVTCRVVGTYGVSAQTGIPNYVTVDGRNTGRINVLAAMSMTAAVFINASAITSNTRNAIGVNIRNLTFDGIARVYPAWLTNPTNGNPITDPQNDYSSPGVINAATYPGGINAVVAANRRNAAAVTTTGYILNLSGITEGLVDNCKFYNHGSFTVSVTGCLRTHVTNNYFNNCGRIDYISPSILLSDFGSARIVTAITKANPAVVTTLDPHFVSGGGTFRLRETNWGGQLPNGTTLYTASSVTSNTVTVSGLNTSGFSGTFFLDGRALLTSDAFVRSEDCNIEGNEFVNLKRFAIQAGGINTFIHANKIRSGMEGGILVARSINTRIVNNHIEDILVSDLVGNGIEVSYVTEIEIANNRISRVDGSGLALLGVYNMDVHDNRIYSPSLRGALLRPYGPFSERYATGSPPQVAGVAMPESDRNPIQVTAYGTLPTTGRIYRNTIDDFRGTVVTAQAIQLNAIASAPAGAINKFSIVDNDFTQWQTTDFKTLINYGTNAVDVQTLHVRGNKKHSSQSSVFHTQVAYSAAITGDQDIAIGFCPSAVKVTVFRSSAVMPLMTSHCTVHKIDTAQSASAANCFSQASDGTNISMTTNPSTIGRLNNTAGTAQWSATFVQWNPDGMRINIGTATVGAVVYFEFYP